MGNARADEPWLPDLCRLRRLAAMLGIAQLVVVVVVLVPDAGSHWDLPRVLSTSGFALWLALSVSVLLCVSRRALSRLPRRTGALVAVALAAAVAGVVAAVVHALFASVGEAGSWPTAMRFVTGSAGVVTLITALALRYFYVIDRWQAQLAAHARAEADALQARIRPHFLFNSMNMIAALLKRDPEVAERAVLDLSDLFRAALGAGEGDSSLAEEVRLVEHYLRIEQLRLGERLRVEWQREEPLPWDLPMPRLVLQPLLENAVLHGISRLPEGGTVGITLAADDDMLRISVRNPSLPPDAPGVHGAGHAQRSIVHRLGYAFGPRARMTCGWDAGYYACELQLPLGELSLGAGGRRTP
ncbi:MULTISPECIES: sensor histidine kinase [unclassified Luteimonas]